MNLSAKSITGAKVQFRDETYRFGKHLHTSIELYLLKAGACFMDIGNQTIHCKEGDFVLILPHVVHSFYVEGNSTCIFSHIHFEPDVFSTIMLSEETEYPLSLMNALLFACNSYHHQKTDSIISECITKVINLYHQETTLLDFAQINITLIKLFLHVLEIYEDSSPTAHTEIQNHYISFTLDYISQNYMNKIVQSEIADSLHISVRYLSKLFARYMGLPMSNYINIFRINKSIVLMDTTDMTLTEIALAIGLSSSQHFSKLFTDVINMTPSNYRKQFLSKK